MSETLKKPDFSIVMPTYNRASSITTTLDACWEQQFSNFELLLVDDGSTDDLAAVIKHIDDPRLVYIRQENAGPAAARNRGMRAATGNYIAFLDADDVWDKDYLKTVQAFMQTEKADFVYSQIIVDRGVGKYWIKPDRAINPDESIYDYLYVAGGFIQTSTMVISRELAEKVSWDESVTFGDNDQFAIDLWHNGGRPRMLPQPMTLYEDILNPAALSQLPIHGGSSEKHTNFFSWMATQKQHMSEKAWLGYRAKFESGGNTPFFKGLAMLRAARKNGAISTKGVLRQLLQNMSPRLYRSLTDKFVALRGKSLDSIRP